jgi:hypothetical protein
MTMLEALQRMKDDQTVGDFLFPALPKPIKGRVGSLSADMVVVESQLGADTYQYVTHPSNVYLVQKKAAP